MPVIPVHRYKSGHVEEMDVPFRPGSLLRQVGYGSARRGQTSAFAIVGDYDWGKVGDMLMTTLFISECGITRRAVALLSHDVRENWYIVEHF